MRNPKLYLVESEVPRVKSYLGLTKTSSERESAVCINLRKNQLNIKLSTQRRNVKRGRKGNETVHIGKYFTETPTVKKSNALTTTHLKH